MRWWRFYGLQWGPLMMLSHWQVAHLFDLEIWRPARTSISGPVRHWWLTRTLGSRLEFDFYCIGSHALHIQVSSLNTAWACDFEQIVWIYKQAFEAFSKELWTGSMDKTIAMPELPGDIWWVILGKYAGMTGKKIGHGSTRQLLQIMPTSRLFKQLVLDLTSTDVHILLEPTVGTSAPVLDCIVTICFQYSSLSTSTVAKRFEACHSVESLCIVL